MPMIINTNACKVNSYFRITANGKIARTGSRPILGWAVKEVIGVAIINPRGIAAGKKSTIVGE